MKTYIISIFALLLGMIAPQLLSAQTDQYEVKVDGLGCPFCAYGLEKKFKEFESIKDVKIEMETGLMTFAYPAAEALTVDQVENQVDAAGYTAVHVKVTRADGSIEETAKADQGTINEAYVTESKIYVAGNCSMCKARIEKASYAIPGVVDAEWSKKTKKLSLKYDKSMITIQDIEAAIAKAGHDTKSHKADNDSYADLPGCCQYDRIP